MIRTVGVIGCGRVGARRALAAARLGLEVIAAADMAIELAQAVVAHGPRGAGLATTDWREVVGRGPDLILVATPHHRLAEIALAAIEAGRHVLIEKPGARTRSELEPVARAAERHGRVVKVGFNHRFHPALRKAREMVQEGAIGPLLHLRGRYGHGGRLGMENEWRCDPDLSGGGELIDQGSHLIDLSRWFLGEVADVQGVLGRHFWDAPVEDNCFITLRTVADQVAWLHASWTEWKNTFSFEVFGRDGKLEVDGLGGSYGVEQLTHHRMLPAMGPPQTQSWTFPEPDRSWDLELQDFLDSVAAGRRPDGDLADALAALAVVERLYEIATPDGRPMSPLVALETAS